MQSTAVTSPEWWCEPRFRRELRRSAGADLPPQVVSIKGTFRREGCLQFNLDADGRPARDGMCSACRALPSLASFQRAAADATADAAAPGLEDGSESIPARQTNFRFLTDAQKVARLRRVCYPLSPTQYSHAQICFPLV